MNAAISNTEESTMKKQQLGRSGLEIAPLVFGGNVFGWTADEATSFDLLDRFFERGFNAVDTADLYSSWAPGLSGGESETVIGKWLARRGRRDDVMLMTKVGLWERRKGLSAGNIAAAVDDSLKRLRTDYIDVYFAHLDDAEVPLAETLAAFGGLVEAGKIRAFGASNYSAERLRESLSISKAQNLPRYEVIQPQYNLYDRSFEAGLACVAGEHDLGVVSFYSLASGFLTGKYRSVDDIRGTAREPFLKDYFDERGLKLLDALFEVADEVGATPAQVALAWLMGRPHLTAPIASATSVAQLDDIMGAADLSLTADAVERLDIASR